MRALCCACYYNNDVEDEDREIVCENSGVELMEYEDGTTKLMKGGVL